MANKEKMKKKSIENSKHSIWAHSEHAINTDSFSTHSHSSSLSDIPSRGIACLRNKTPQFLSFATIFKFFSFPANPPVIQSIEFGR